MRPGPELAASYALGILGTPAGFGTVDAVSYLLLLVGIYGFFLGAVLASFACVVAERVPAGLSIQGRSKCVCGRQLRALENIPIFGWLRVGGVARCCGAQIPPRYVYAEVLAGDAGAVAAISVAFGVHYAHPVCAVLAAAAVLYIPATVTAVLWRRA